ncbi:hypothetical protein NE237_003842 [Protea cynaroides]|uniref:Uncharacterized protein n=1 Tax=Protea cynaroides TaxID=273540 RepID=A0A9Q0KHH8_9MAGN|nr:hypothetical protein NE237_003842 [Protea cynaroides]
MSISATAALIVQVMWVRPVGLWIELNVDGVPRGNQAGQVPRWCFQKLSWDSRSSFQFKSINLTNLRVNGLGPPITREETHAKVRGVPIQPLHTQIPGDLCVQ